MSATPRIPLRLLALLLGLVLLPTEGLPGPPAPKTDSLGDPLPAGARRALARCVCGMVR